jgi:uncharacterized protein (UPF0212 family)
LDVERPSPSTTYLEKIDLIGGNSAHALQTLVMTQKRRTGPTTPELCPVCGEEVPPGALACPECGADHNSGWRENADAYDGVNLPDDDFVKQEFGSRLKPEGLKMVWWIAGIVLIAALILMYLYAAH